MYAEKIKQKKLQNGAVVLAIPFSSKDVVSIVGSIAGGIQAWGSEEEALVHAQMLLEGTTKHSKEDIQKLLDSMGATLQFTAGDYRLMFLAKVRPTHIEEMVKLIVECLKDSAFPEPELAVLKMREAARLQLEAQDTKAQASAALARMLFKPQHPNYSETTEESVHALKNITTKALRERHSQLIDGRTLILSLAGDIRPATAYAFAEKYFKSLPHNSVTFKKYVKSAPVAAKKALLSIPNKASVDFLTGIATGIIRDSAEYPALFLGTQILGKSGGFVGRLMKTVREEDGLTYGVYAYATGFTTWTDGYIYIWATFASQLFAKGKASITKQIKLLLTKGVTDTEVQKHRELYVSAMKVQLSNSLAFARAAHDTTVEGKPLSYLDEFPKKILGLKTAAVNKALKKYVIASKLSEAAAGPLSVDLNAQKR